MKPYLANKTITQSVLNKYKLKANKSFGQNFLIDDYVLNEIVNNSEITKEDIVIEIGPGIGTLTQYLSEAAAEVIAVEIDKKLIPVLEDTLNEFHNVRIINEDVLKVNLSEIAKQYDNEKKIKVVANLPYYITTPIMMKLLEETNDIDSITVMIQAEVADRLCAKPSTKDYGAITLAVNFYSKVEKIIEVSRESFAPAPHVDSTVIKLTKIKEHEIEPLDKDLLFKIIQASFNQRRKTLVNGIKNYSGLNFSKEEIEEALEKMGIDTQIRGEKLSLNDFVKLSNIFYNMKNEN